MSTPALNKIKKNIIKAPFAVPLYHTIKKMLLYPHFIKDFFLFRKMAVRDGRFPMKWIEQHPCLLDKTATTGFEPHYIYHPAWAARIIERIKPKFHIDISSTLHFCSIVSAFIPIEFYDYRPANLNLSNLSMKKADLLKLPFINNSIKSLSCMHVIEHVGLGRYGDILDPLGDIRAINELKRVLAHGGSLIFVVPVGRPKVAFNAHRIYSYKQVIENFEDLELKEFSLVPDNFKEAGIIYNADPSLVQKQDWGCGCFWFIKK